MARNVPPTRVSYTETTWNTAATSKSTASISWLAGDVLIAIGGTESGTTLGVPTGTGLSFSSLQLNTAVSTCGARVAIATPGSSGSSAVTMTNSGSFNYGFGVWVWRGSDGVGTGSEQHTTAHFEAVDPVDTHSAWMIGVFDFSAAAATNTLIPTVTNVVEQAVENGQYTAYVGDIVDQASDTSTNYGIDPGGTSGTLTIVTAEVLGTTSAADNTMRVSSPGMFDADVVPGGMF